MSMKPKTKKVKPKGEYHNITYEVDGNKFLIRTYYSNGELLVYAHPYWQPAEIIKK